MKAKIKAIFKKTIDVLSLVFGYAIMISLFIGGLSFLGYVVALIIGGDTAENICKVIYKDIYPHLVYWTSVIVLLGLVIMYIKGETALSSKKKKLEKIEKTAEAVKTDEPTKVDDTPTNEPSENAMATDETKTS